MNFVGLCALTAVMACDVGVISALAASAGMGSLVAEAAVITALLVAGLTWLGRTTGRPPGFPALNALNISYLIRSEIRTCVDAIDMKAYHVQLPKR